MSHEKRWRSEKGRKVTKSGRIIESKIEIQESDRTMQLPPDKGPFGIPISAELGVKLISDFHDLLDKSIRNALLSGKGFNLDDFKTTERGDKKKIEEIVNQLIELLKKSAAVTIEKNILLKTLSQPECEGVRFHLCKKTVKNSSGEKEIFISLVTVGVDINGKDLLYEHQADTNKAKKSKAESGDVSLVGEYGHPPGSSPTKSRDLSRVYDPKRYILLNRAIEISKKKK